MDLQMFVFAFILVITNPVRNRVKITTFLIRRQVREGVKM